MQRCRQQRLWYLRAQVHVEPGCKSQVGVRVDRRHNQALSNFFVGMWLSYWQTSNVPCSTISAQRLRGKLTSFAYPATPLNRGSSLLIDVFNFEHVSSQVTDRKYYIHIDKFNYDG